jgi:branched-chain amino acid transport system substrate-binding protein
MSAPSDTPKWLRDQPQIPVRERAFVTLVDRASLSAQVHQDQSEHASSPEPSEEVSSERHDPDAVLRNRLALIFLIVVGLAIPAIFAKPLWQGAHALLEADSQIRQASNPSDQLTANSAPTDRSVVMAPKIVPNPGSEPPASSAKTSADSSGTAPASLTKITADSRAGSSVSAIEIPENLKPSAGASKTPANSEAESLVGATKTTVGSKAESFTGATKITAGVEPSTIAQAQQAPRSPIARPLDEESRTVSNPVQGVTDTEIRFGISAPLSGAAKELGQNMKMGIGVAFSAANANGGVHGRQLRLIAADDGYEPTRTADTMKQLYEKDQVFGVIGNVGTPTAAVAVPYALQHKMMFFGAFTGAGLLRKDPPDRYVFNYRASYAEETAAVVYYLVKVRRLRPGQIAVFAQQDAYGDAGFVGVAKAIRSLGGDDGAILRLNYQRNTVDVDEAVAQLQAHNSNRQRNPIKAVIMVPTYRAAAAFIKQTRDRYPNMIYTSVSFVGSTALANELMLLGKRYATGVIVTQVVPELDGYSSLVLNYKSALAKYFPGEAPDYVSLEGYVAANVLIAALKRNGPQLSTESLVDTLENLRDLDIGLGTPVSFSGYDHQGVHKVWATQFDDNGHYQSIDLQ